MVQIKVSSALVFAVVALNSASTMAAPAFGHSEVSHQTHHRPHVQVHHPRHKLAGRTVKLPGSGLTNHRTPQGPLRLNHGPVVTHPNHHHTILARKIPVPVLPGLTHHHTPQGPLRLNHGPVVTHPNHRTILARKIPIPVLPGLTHHHTPQGPLRLNHGPVVTHPNHHRTILARKIPVLPRLPPHHHTPQGPVVTHPNRHHTPQGPLRPNHGPLVKTSPVVARDLELEVRDFNDELEIRDVDDIEARAVHPKSHSKPLHTSPKPAPKTHKAPSKPHSSRTDKIGVAVDAAGVAVDAANGIATAVKSRGLVEERDLDLEVRDFVEREFLEDEE
ncbi:hypothetical protein C8J56DRAFT_1056852 [Mycena floridula]|nr:hypothetical protein C8J56DRAFT_1056852 [Mycena floridula]